MKNFLKSIVVGLGAVAPGLSGSILLVMFGLYQKIVNTVSNIFKNFKKNVLFLLPIGAGIVVGVLLFSKLIVIPLEAFPLQTHFAFLGLILGTVPMLFQEVKKEGFSNQYYIFMAASFVLGTVFFLFNLSAFPDVVNPNFLQSVLLGLAVSAAYLVPGVDSFAILSSFGLYNLWLYSINELDFKVLLPAALGVCIGGVVISLIFNKLLSRWYTGTYSVIFGLFLAVILNFAVKDIALSDSIKTAGTPGIIVSVLLLLVGFAASILFGNLEQLGERMKKAKAEKGNE